MTKQKAPVVNLPRALYMWRRSREHLPGRPPTTTIQRDLPPFKRPSISFHPPMRFCLPNILYMEAYQKWIRIIGQNLSN